VGGDVINLLSTELAAPPEALRRAESGEVAAAGTLRTRGEGPAIGKNTF
jgi:hypothetical protein